ncbi:MAG: type III pantothenate kinase [Gammaproteobacteria bacterium]
MTAAPVLLLDIGNSRLKWGLAHGRRLGECGAIVHDGDPAAALRAAQLPDVSEVWIAHVTGEAHEAQLSAAVQQLYGCTPRYARSSARWRGLHNAYREPARLGVDRWLALIAAWDAARAALCVVDAGTALTVDCVDDGGRHLGGIIAGGLQTQQHAVLGRTRFATRAEEAAYDGGLGRDTEACVRQGAMLACLGAIDRASAVAGQAARGFICGGDAEILLPCLGPRWEHHPYLVLEGLLLIADDR